MARINISLALIGHMPANFNPGKVTKLKPSAFNIAGDIACCYMLTDAACKQTPANAS